jgi:hypothetical protein
MRKKLILPLLFAVLYSSCAHNTVKDAKMNDVASQGSAPEANSKDAVSIEAKLAAAQDDTSQVTEVKFEKGTNRLSKSYDDKIIKALESAEKIAPITHITIVAWSDLEMPKKHQKLSNAAVDLAKVRAKTIEEFIHVKRPKISVETVNMAEHPTKFKKFLKTNDVRIQQALIDAGSGDSKAGHAIVIIEIKQKK